MANFDKKSPNSEQKSSFSEHFLALSQQDKERYADKLTVEGQRIADPYTIPDEFWENNCCKWPNIEYGDVWNYLVNTPGLYTQEAMKAYKSLDGYNFFISGHVQPVLYHDTQNTPVCILTAKVIPSEKVSGKKQWHHPWLMVNKRGGYIVAAHCSCKAGAGEACSHIAAVLFKVEAAIKLGLNNPAKTSLANQWNKCYREKVTAQPLSEIKFSRPVHGKVQRKRKALIEPPLVLTEFEEAEALRRLKRVCPDACILTKDDSDTDTASDDEEMPPVLVREHTICCESLTPDELMKECENLLEDLKVTPVQASNLEKNDQSTSRKCTLEKAKSWKDNSLLSA